MTQEMIYERQLRNIAILNDVNETLRLPRVLSLIATNDDSEEDKSINTMPLRPQGKIILFV